MSFFIAGQAFPVASDFAAARIAVFAGLVLSALIGVAILWNAQRQEGTEDWIERRTGDVGFSHTFSPSRNDWKG